MKLKKKLSSVSDEQHQWAQDELFKKHFVAAFKSHYCLECGNKWHPNGTELSYSVIGSTCPSCDTELKRLDGWETDASHHAYWAIIKVVENFQVVRMFTTEKYMKKHQPVEYIHQEVMQHWVRDDGKMTSLSKTCFSMGAYYIDQWVKHSKLEPRTGSHTHVQRCNIEPDKIMPGRTTLPVIRRNGYKGHFYDVPPHVMFSAILSDSRAETLLKAKQLSLFRRFFGHSGANRELLDDYWPSIRIAMRNNYTIKSAGLWMDYIKMLDSFDMDLRNAEYVCPDDLQAEHDRYVEKANRRRSAKQLARKMDKIQRNEAGYKHTHSKFFGIKIVHNDIVIEPLRSVQEFADVGSKLHHCIFGSEYYLRQNSLVLTAKINGELIETIEVDLEEFKVKQSRGLQNHPTERHEDIVNAMNKNMKAIIRAIDEDASHKIDNIRELNVA